jgi:hypothetical protein
MGDQTNKAIDSRRFIFAQSFAQSIAQNSPTCAQPSSFQPRCETLSYCKYTARKAWSGLWNQGSRVQIPSLTPKLQDSTRAKIQDPLRNDWKAGVEQNL